MSYQNKRADGDRLPCEEAVRHLTAQHLAHRGQILAALRAGLSEEVHPQIQRIPRHALCDTFWRLCRERRHHLPATIHDAMPVT